MAERGWDATGLLKPLWREYKGGRDQLATDVGTKGSSLSQVNTGGRRLGLELGQKLAGALGVSLAELGAPEAVAADDPRSQGLLARLESLAEKVAYLLDREATLTADLGDAHTRIAQLETARKPVRAAATRQKTRR